MPGREGGLYDGKELAAFGGVKVSHLDADRIPQFFQRLYECLLEGRPITPGDELDFN